MDQRDEVSRLIANLDAAISALTKFRLSQDLPDPSEFDSIETDSYGQLIDKLLVVHIRYWNLENEMSSELGDSDLADRRRLSEPLFKVWRPMLVRALDKKNVNTLQSLQGGETDLFSQLPKSYKGWKSRDT